MMLLNSATNGWLTRPCRPAADRSSATLRGPIVPAGNWLAGLLTATLCVTSIFAAGVPEARAAQRAATQSSKEQQAFFKLADQLSEPAFQNRATPVTEPGVPGTRVETQWEIDLLRLTEDSFVLTYKSEPEYRFYVQALLCNLDGTTKIPDGTVLGAREKAATFYEANYSFHVKDDVEFARCTIPQTHMSVTGSALDPGEKSLYESHDRVLRQMCNWLRFLAKEGGDTPRAADFLTIILARHTQELMSIDSKGDLERLEGEMGFFDRVFPFEIFDDKAVLSDAARRQAREFFQTTILLRRKLALLAPKTAEKSSRDQALLQLLQ